MIKKIFLSIFIPMLFLNTTIVALGKPAEDSTAIVDTQTEDVVIEETPQISKEEKQQAIHDLRVKKCRIIIFAFYNYKNSGGEIAKSNFLPHVEYFISYHEKLERENPGVGDGFGSTWFWSLIYGGANFGMTCYGIAPGNCAGPLDVKHYPLVLDPLENIRHHCNEMFGFYKQGVRGINLCKHVFLPANPRDWGNGRFRGNGEFRRTTKKHLEVIGQAYEKGILP